MILRMRLPKTVSVPKPFQRVARYFDVTKSFETLITLRQVARHYHAGFLATLMHFLRLHLIDKFRRVEIFRLGIADPATPATVMAEVMSTVRGIQLQRKINPQGYEDIVEDKALLYTFCMGAKIRVPQLYAVYDSTHGWATNGQLLGSKDEWVRFLQEEVPDHFVIKPARGQQGRMVNIFSRQSGGFVDYADQRYSAADLVDLMALSEDFDRFVLQERIENHPDLVELTGTTALQTIRIVTGIDKKGEVRFLFAAQRLAAELNAADNFHYGTSGNGVAEICLDSGRIVQAVIGTDDGFEMKTVETPSKTGRPLIGYQEPYWQEAKDLVLDASYKFLPLKTIAWDVGMTPEGPLIIEGNLWWGIGTFSALRRCSRFSAYVEEMQRDDAAID